MKDFIVDAIFSFGEAMNVVKSPKTKKNIINLQPLTPIKKLLKRGKKLFQKVMNSKPTTKTNLTLGQGQ